MISWTPDTWTPLDTEQCTPRFLLKIYALAGWTPPSLDTGQWPPQNAFNYNGLERVYTWTPPLYKYKYSGVHLGYHQIFILNFMFAVDAPGKTKYAIQIMLSEIRPQEIIP